RDTGARVKRVEDPRLLGGRGRDLDDIVLPRMVSLAFGRSPHAHAAIRLVDASTARRLDGVLGVFTADDLRALARPLQPRLEGDGFTPTAWPALADGRVNFCAEAVAAVVATSGYVAADARELVRVEYEPLPVLASIDAALALPSTRVRILVPDVGGGFGLKSHVFPEDVTVAAIARQLGRPVKWMEERRESLAAASQARAQRMDVEVAVGRDGVLLGLRARAVSDGGAYHIYPLT